jgi:hypothetical protein
MTRTESRVGQEADLEIYKQRYETYRHLDKLRWQILQIVVAVGSAAVLTLRATPGQVQCKHTLRAAGGDATARP